MAHGSAWVCAADEICYFAGRMSTLLIATRNKHKVSEIQAILGEHFRYLTLNEVRDAPTVVEDADTFAGNATKKAVALARWVGQRPTADLMNQGQDTTVRGIFVLADDSGLEVDALNGMPGVHSARFAALDYGRAGNSSDAENNAKLLRLLANVPREKRTARFRCILALAPVVTTRLESASPVCYADEVELAIELFEGTCEGTVAFEPRGKGGFGYDPLFVPNGYTQSFAELGESVKNGLSHRARALENLKKGLVGA